MGTNVIRRLVREHRELAAQAERLGRPRVRSAGAVCDTLVTAVHAHVAAERDWLASTGTRRDLFPARELADVRNTAERLATLATELGANLSTDRAQALATLLRRHDAVMTGLTNRLAAAFDVNQLRRLGELYERTHRAQLKALSRSVPKPSRRLDVSRTELYERARRAGVPGRADMTRDQLIAVLDRLAS